MEFVRLETGTLKDVTDDYYYGCCSSWAGLFGLPVLARHRRVKGVTSTRLPDSRADALASVVTSL
jgi:hypothetical protein